MTVAGAGEDELERAWRIRLDVVATEPVAIARRSIGARDGREPERVAGLLYEAHVLGAVVGQRALDERIGVDLPPEPLLEPQLRERDLASGLGGLELRYGPVPDSVRLDADAACLERRELVPADGRVANAERAQRLLVRQRAVPVEKSDRDEDHCWITVALEDRQRVLEVVAVAVVEGDEDGAGRQWSAVDVVIAHLIERHRRVAETRRVGRSAPRKPPSARSSRSAEGR